MKIEEGYLEEARIGQLVSLQERLTRRELCGIGLAEEERRRKRKKEEVRKEGVLEVRGFWFLGFTS